MEQAARQLQVAPYTLRDWLKTGRVRGVKIGRLWRVPRSALEELGHSDALESNEREGADAQAPEIVAARISAFEQWCHSHSDVRSDAPPLPDSALSRDSVYGDRGA